MRIACGLTLFICSFVLVSTQRALAQADSQQGVAIDSVLNEIQRGLTQAQVIIADNKNLPPLESVSLTLQTEYVKKGGPKFTLFVISFGQTWEKQSSNELTLVLKPPPKKATEAVGTPEGLSDQLVGAIVSAATGVQAAKDRKPPLLLDSMKAEFGFVVNTKTSGGVKFEIVPVTAELGGELSKKAVHKISVSFANPSKTTASVTAPTKPHKQ